MFYFKYNHNNPITGVTFTYRSDLPAQVLAAIHDVVPEWHQSLLRAVRDSDCDYMLVTQQAGRFFFPRQRAAPRMLVMGDDYGLGGSRGPAAFDAQSIRIFLPRCAMVVLISGAPDRALYEMAASVAAHQRRNVLVIETRPPHDQDWMRFIGEVAPHVQVLSDVPPSERDQ